MRNYELVSGLSHDGKNVDKSHTLFPYVRCEVVLPLKIQIHSIRVALAIRMIAKEKHNQQLRELEALDENYLKA